MIDDEQIEEALQYLKKKGLCSNEDNKPSKKVINKLMSENISNQEFNEVIENELDADNKKKLKSSLRRKKTDENHPKKSYKIMIDTAKRFDNLKGELTIDAFMNELLDKYEGK